MADPRLRAGLIAASLLLAPPAFAEEEDGYDFELGITAIGEWYPKLGEQQSVLTGGRIHVGIYDSIFAIVEAGYTAAGNVPGDGDDGLMIGTGVEAGIAPIEILEIVVRATIDLRVTQFTDSPSGTLSNIGAVLASGVRLLRLIEVHVMGGFAFHGAFGIGLGAAIGFFF